MIKVNGIEIKPTIFPDGTSQVWKLPKELTNALVYDVEWRFEAEREIIDLLSLDKLLNFSNSRLYIPYLPYARQDKPMTNDNTFNLRVLADLINSMGFLEVYSLDAHSIQAELWINNFHSKTPKGYQLQVLDKFKPDSIVYPDKGAKDRYSIIWPSITFDKVRDQSTGTIVGHVTSSDLKSRNHKKFLIIDDICDGGATFISVAKAIRKEVPDAIIGLFVSHGIFSKGLYHLTSNGIDHIYTTDSYISVVEHKHVLEGVFEV